jgi:hypothetical protein
MSTAPWAALVELAEREYELVCQERWDEVAEASSARLAAARALGAPPAAARPDLERLGELQAQITAGLSTSRALTLRKLGGMQKTRTAVRGYVTAGFATAGPRIDGRG